MKNIITIAVHEFKIRVRSKWFLISTFGLPLIIIGLSLLSGYMAGSGANSEVKIYGIIDETGQYGQTLANNLARQYVTDNGPLYRFRVESEPLERLQADFDTLANDGSLDGYFVIPAKLTDSTSISFYSKRVGQFRDINRFERALNQLLIKEKAKQFNLDSTVVKNLLARVKVESYEIGRGQKLSSAQEAARYLGPFAFVFLLFMGVFMGAQLLMRGIIEERSNRVIEVLLSVVNYNELMAGKIIGLAGLGITQSFLYLFVISIVSQYFGVSIVNTNLILLFVAYFILGYLWWAALFMAIGSLFDSEQDAQQAVSFVSIFAVVPIMLWTLVIQSPNSTLVNILTYIPAFTPYFMIMKLAVHAAGPVQVGSTLVVMLIAVYYTMRIAGKVFRTAVLMYGKRITLPEIFRWIRN